MPGLDRIKNGSFLVEQFGVRTICRIHAISFTLIFPKSETCPKYSILPRSLYGNAGTLLNFLPLSASVNPTLDELFMG